MQQTPKPRLYIISGHTRMGEQKIPYAGLTCQCGPDAVSIRLYPHKRKVYCHNTAIMPHLPAIAISELLVEKWETYLPEITETLLELVKIGAASPPLPPKAKGFLASLRGRA